MRLHYLCVAAISSGSLIMLAGCSSAGFAVEADEGAYPAAYTEWPGYYDPNYPYYWTLHDHDFDHRDFNRDHDRGDHIRRDGHEGGFREGRGGEGRAAPEFHGGGAEHHEHR